MAKRMHFVSFLVLALALALSSPASASLIGNWSGSDRSWNHSDMAITKALMEAAGHTVEADEAITAANLSNDDLFVVGEPTGTPTGAELTDLGAWVTGGGILLVFLDSGDSGLTGANAIWAGIGSSLVGGGSPANAPLASGIFASEGPPFDIVGMLLEITPGTAVTGGNALAGTYIRWEAIGSGFVFGFADRSDHNFFAPSTTDVNGQLLLNLAAGPGVVTPEPGTVSLLGVGLAVLSLARRRKGRS